MTRQFGRALCLVIVSLLTLVIPAPAHAQETPATVKVELHLKDGTVLIGEVVSKDAGKIRFRSQALGEITIAADDVLSRGPAAAAELVATPPAPAGPVTTTPKGIWTRTIAAGAAWVGPPFTQGALAGGLPGLTGAAMRLPGAQTSVQTTVTVTHTSPVDDGSLSGSYTYVDNQPTGRVTGATALDLQYSRLITKRMYVVSRSSFRRDTVRNIDNSFAELAGLGRKVIDTRRLRADVVLGGALLRENTNTRFDDTYQPQAGMMEVFALQLNPRAQFTHRATYRVGLRESTIWSLETYTGLQGALTSRLSIALGLTWNYDNILGDAVTRVPANALFSGSPALTLFANQKTFRQITSNLQFTF